jgi:hypothetical protein
MFDACPVHPKGTMVIPMLWRISGYVVCMLGVKNQKLHIPPYHDRRSTCSTCVGATAARAHRTAFAHGIDRVRSLW